MFDSCVAAGLKSKEGAERRRGRVFRLERLVLERELAKFGLERGLRGGFRLHDGFEVLDLLLERGGRAGAE